MSTELIRSWLQLPAGDWPPNHYVLLGLQPGESDHRRIEDQVHERMMTLRPYQLSHPEAATEAMNRIAQAFACLTDPAVKRAYDTELFPDRVVYVEEEKVVRSAPAVPMPAPDPDDPLGWLYGPWNKLKQAPVQVFDWSSLPSPGQTDDGAVAEGTGTVTAEPVAEPAASVREPVPIVTAEAVDTAPKAEPADPIGEAGRTSSSAKRGLGTKRALYRRVATTRKLYQFWNEAGAVLNHPKRKLAKPTEAVELVHQLTMIRQFLRGFPPILGEAGQPGYLVVTLARQQMIVPTFRSLLGSQREALARDWRSGVTLLQSHLAFLRQEAKLLRRKSRWGRVARAVRAFVTDQPGTLLILLGLLILNLALWSSR